MSKEYKKLLGNRVYLEIDLPNYSIEMSESAKKDLVREAASKLNRTKVLDIGTTVTNVAIGDEVLVSKEGILRGDIINLSPTKTVALVNPLEIIHIW